MSSTTVDSLLWVAVQKFAALDNASRQLIQVEVERCFAEGVRQHSPLFRQ